MKKYNPKNERIKREYFLYLKEAKVVSGQTIDNIRKSIDRYEKYTKYEDFSRFNKHKASAFKKHFGNQKSRRNGKLLSKSTYISTLRNLKDFFLWLRLRSGYRRLDIHHVEYLNFSDRDVAVARSKKIKEYPTFEQIRKVLSCMSAETEIEMRNRALIAFTALTGVRDSAIASLKLKHIDLNRNLVEQLPDEVKTKFSKTIYTYFFPVGDDIKQIVIDWIHFLRNVKLYDESAPVFPSTKLAHDENFELKPVGLQPKHWSTANQIRKIFKEGFESAGLKYYTPHSFRTTICRLGEQVCRTPEQFKAWSQNIGHENPLTTFMSYGHIDEYRQGEIISNVVDKDKDYSNKRLFEELMELKKRSE